MTNDCLAKKIKGVINDSKLKVLNAIRVGIVTDGTTTPFFGLVKAQKAITLKADQNIFDGSDTFVATNVVTARGQRVSSPATPTSYNLQFSNKYDLISINMPKQSGTWFNNILALGVNDFENCNNLETLTMPQETVGFKSVSLATMENLTDFTMTYSDLAGTLEEFVEQFIENFPLKIKNIKLITGCYFNGTYYDPIYVSFNAGTATVYTDEEMTTSIGSYDGTVWTYNS